MKKVLIGFLLSGTFLGAMTSCGGPSDKAKKDDKKNEASADTKKLEPRQKDKSDREKLALNGKVKTVKQRVFNADTSSGEIKKGEMKGPPFSNFNKTFTKDGMIKEEVWMDNSGSVQRKITCEYDDQGNKIKEVRSRKEGEVVTTIEWKYNEKGKKVKELRKNKEGKTTIKVEYQLDPEGYPTKNIRYNQKGKKLEEIRFKYNKYHEVVEKQWYTSKNQLDHKRTILRDDQGRVARRTTIDDSGQEAGRFSFSYDDKGNRTEVKQFDENGELVQWRNYEYNDKGHIVKEVHKDPSGKTKKKVSYTHTYDDNGNWTKRVMMVHTDSGKGATEVSTREYSYF